MLKKALLVAFALTLFALPLVIRWLYFYDGEYEPGEVARPELDAIQAPTPEMAPFVDHSNKEEPGTVLIDMMHDNRFAMTELSVLQARLAARGLNMKLVGVDDDLASQLRHAQALVVISPGKSWTRDEIRLAREFTDKGGRILLVTDPTRFGVVVDEYGEYIGLDSDADYSNDLAAEFGIIFQPDYLYNTAENEGNFRNIKLTSFADDKLTRGLDQIVFYATHSIVSDMPSLVTADGETRSSSVERSEDLVVSVLAANGSVLALGDLTFMAEPYSAVYDNYQFVANIADFLSSAERRYDLADFPFFYGDKVDLVYAGDALLDSDLLKDGGALQAFFEVASKELRIRDKEDPESDTLFMGLYEEPGEAEPYLATAQVTLWISPTDTTDESEQAEVEVTPTPELTVTAGSDVGTEAELGATGEVTPVTESRVEVAGLGEMVMTGTSLFLLQADGDRQVLVVLADTEDGLKDVVSRMTEGGLGDCIRRDTRTPEDPVTSFLAMCPTGEVAPGEGNGGWPDPEVLPPTNDPSASATPAAGDAEEEIETTGPSESQGRILVVALDDGSSRYDGLTSADSFSAALADRYEVTVLSQSQDGQLPVADYFSHDLVIWTAGDFENAFGEEESELLILVLLEGIPAIVSGAFVGDGGVESPQRDIKVSDALHPMAIGYDPQEVISFLPSPSGSVYETQLFH
ncbi:hypothetical protein ACFLWA_10715, partial [Chloroflexota bacterium]